MKLTIDKRKPYFISGYIREHQKDRILQDIVSEILKFYDEVISFMTNDVASEKFKSGKFRMSFYYAVY